MPTPNNATLMLACNSTLNAGFAPGAGLALLADANGKPMTMVSSSGCTAAAYRDASGDVIIAFQGTTTDQQIAADLQIVQGNTKTPAFGDALAFAQSVQAVAAADGLSSVSVTGHSLGGTLAEYVASRTGLGGASYAGSGVPGYAAPATRPANFTSYVEYGDPWANLASDAGERAIAPHADHYGTVSMLGSASASASVAAVVHDVQALRPAMFTGHLSQAMQTLETDFRSAMGTYHPLAVYAVDLGRTGMMPGHLAS